MISVIKEKQEKLLQLCLKFRVKNLYLFGSAVNDKFYSPESDLDFLVVFESVTPEEHAQLYFGLLQELQDLFGREIDLVELGAIRNPYFREGVESSRVIIYAA